MITNDGKLDAKIASRGNKIHNSLAIPSLIQISENWIIKKEQDASIKSN